MSLLNFLERKSPRVEQVEIKNIFNLDNLVPHQFGLAAYIIGLAAYLYNYSSIAYCVSILVSDSDSDLLLHVDVASVMYVGKALWCYPCDVRVSCIQT